MSDSSPTPRILRVAAWIWLGYFLAMGVMDFVLYTQFRLPLNPNQVFGNNPPLTPLRMGFSPVYLYYAVNGLVAGAFLAVAYWEGVQKALGCAFYPLLITTLSAAPILISVLVVPSFPNGPLANAEGMALRQLPILFIALALVAWQYELVHVILFSIATTTLELFLVTTAVPRNQAWLVLYFIAIIRTISFIAVGVFISLLVTRLREQQEALRQANANLTHYAATLEQLTVSRERNRLARELHDTLAHSLTALSVTLETIKAYFDLDPAKTLRVHLTHTSPHTTLTVEDDGTGYDLHAQKHMGHFGLVGMQERAELVGGKLGIESEKGRGTKVVVTI